MNGKLRSLIYQHPHCAVVLAITLLLGLHYSVSTMERPEKDALRYMDYAYNLASHQTFGLSCDQLNRPVLPGNANAPLYPAVLALNVMIDPALKSNFACFIRASGLRDDCVVGSHRQAQTSTIAEDQCHYHYRPVMAVQYGFAGASLLLVWLLTRALFNNNRIAWLAMLAAFSAGLLTEFAGMLLTETLVMVLFLLFQYRLVVLLQQPNTINAVFMAVVLALLTLTRPEYLYLSVFTLLLIGCLVARSALAITRRQLFIALLSFSCTLAPWSARNHYHFGSAELVKGNYAEIILAQRLAYNHMTVQEWLGSFVYWIPDFGDSLAKRIFPESWYWRHQDRPGAFREIAAEKITESIANGKHATVTELLQSEVFSQPLTHALVTLPLAWRGALIGYYWGIIGFIGYCCLLWQTSRRQQWTLWIISLPGWFLVIFHAAISINVPRYNLPLIGLYALGWGWILQTLLDRWQALSPAQAITDTSP